MLTQRLFHPRSPEVSLGQLKRLLSSWSVHPKDQTLSPQSTISFCPVCGKSVKVSFKFCPYCGKILPVEEEGDTLTGTMPLVSSVRGSRRDLNSSSETSAKKVKWSHTVTSLPLSIHFDCDSSGSDDTLSSPDRTTGPWGRPLTPKGSPLSTRLSPQTLKWSRVTTSLQALPTGTELTDQMGSTGHWGPYMGFTYRYRPGGKHVAYKEGSHTRGTCSSLV